MIYTFDFKNFSSVSDIEDEFRKIGAKHYCYRFSETQEVIKFGKGNDKEWKKGYWGNRVVRQSDALVGWDSTRFHACTSVNVFKNQLNTHFPNITKDDVNLTIYDFTCLLMGKNDAEIDQQLLDIEGRLVNSHIQQFGYRPKCNIAKVRKQWAVNNFSVLFD